MVTIASYVESQHQGPELAILKRQLRIIPHPVTCIMYGKNVAMEVALQEIDGTETISSLIYGYCQRWPARWVSRIRVARGLDDLVVQERLPCQELQAVPHRNAPLICLFS